MKVVLLALVLLLLSACGGAPRDVAPASAEAVPPVGPTLESSYGFLPPLPIGSTPWPTFTLAPTLIPTPSPAPTRPPAPTATPWPRFSPGEAPTSAPALGAGGLDRRVVFLEKQSLLPFRGGELPDYLQKRDWDRMPVPAPVFSSDARYMLWVVAFDFTEASPGYELQGLVRWQSMRPGSAPVVMFEVPVTLSRLSPFFYHGLGRDDPGLWLPGLYRVDFLDASGALLTHAEFEVRR